jgi:hypothetical protein
MVLFIGKNIFLVPIFRWCYIVALLVLDKIVYFFSPHFRYWLVKHFFYQFLPLRDSIEYGFLKPIN